MKTVYLQNIVYRLVGPGIQGVIAYLLILLIYNNLGQLQEQFFGNELYMCIFLSYMVQEVDGLLWKLYQRMLSSRTNQMQWIVFLVTSVIMTCVLVATGMTVYYNSIVGFPISVDELVVFIAVYVFFTLLYCGVQIGHQAIQVDFDGQRAEEQEKKDQVLIEFSQFKKEVNPQLLFESLEALISLMESDPEKIDVFIDDLATVYRHLLNAKKQELISFQEERKVLETFVNVYNQLSYRNVKLAFDVSNELRVIPATFLFLVEKIVQTTLRISEQPLEILFKVKESTLCCQYVPSERIFEQLSIENLSDINHMYSFYSAASIQIIDKPEYRQIQIPLLTIEQIL